MSGSSWNSKLPLRKLIIQENDSSFSKIPGVGNVRGSQTKGIRSVAKKLSRVQSFSAMKPKLRGLSPNKSVQTGKNSFKIFKFATPIEEIEAELVGRIQNVKSQGFDYISEVYSLAKAAFQKIIEMDAVFGRVLSLIKENYEKYYDTLLADLPTYKRKQQTFQMDEPHLPKYQKINRPSPAGKIRVPQLQVPMSDSVPEFQQEFMSNFDKFSISWRKLLLNQKVTS